MTMNVFTGLAYVARGLLLLRGMKTVHVGY